MATYKLLGDRHEELKDQTWYLYYHERNAVVCLVPLPYRAMYRHIQPVSRIAFRWDYHTDAGIPSVTSLPS